MQKKRPNIVFILSDDQGEWALHCSGTRALYTPNIDHLALEGARFNHFYCASPVCSPARASLLTGQLPSAHGVMDWLSGGNLRKADFEAQAKENPYGHYQEETEPITFLEGKKTYTDYLFEAGYELALSGKWHLGNSLEPQHGFSKWFTIGQGGCHYYHPDLVEEGTIKVEHGTYVTEAFTDKALEFLDELAEGAREGRPFYLGLHYTAPHDPWGEEHHPAKWIDHYKECDFREIPDEKDHPDLQTGPVYGTAKRAENLTGYFAAISKMDEEIGRILRALDEKGLMEDTLIIFTSDNGMCMGHHGVWGKGNATAPFNLYEESVKVPFIISWKGHLPGGRVVYDMVSAYDLFPTILELCGIKEREEDRRLRPGKSFAGLLLEEQGKGERGERPVVIYSEYGPARMIRKGPCKYIQRLGEGEEDELYDLGKDPLERRSRIHDPEYQHKIKELRGLMDDWFEAYALPGAEKAARKVDGMGQKERLL